MWNMEDSKVQKRTWQDRQCHDLHTSYANCNLATNWKSFQILWNCRIAHFDCLILSIFPLDKSPRMKWLVQQSFRITSIPASQDFTRQTEKLTQPRFDARSYVDKIWTGQGWSSHQAVQSNLSKHIKVYQSIRWNVVVTCFSRITWAHMGLGHSAEQPPQLQRQILAQATSYFLRVETEFQFVASVASVASLPGKSSCCCQNPTARTSEEIDRNDIRHFATAIDWLEKCQKM